MTLEFHAKEKRSETRELKRVIDTLMMADLPELKSCFGPATVFMSHCWGAKFGDLIGAACHGARKDRVVCMD